MPFSQGVRDQALVAAARHCCACHRYKGVKIEVHHIIPESQEGASDIENAIALCFDCHADAGHYNPAHPRGTKFSPNELRRHRDNWHSMVHHHAIHPPDAPDLLYCRYLLCNSFEAFREITLGDLSNVPANEPFLVTNPVRNFQRQIVDGHPNTYRHDQEWGDSFESHEAYSLAHPDVRVLERSSINLYPYFEAVRDPSLEELRERLAPRDAVTRLLVAAGVSPREISFALAYNELCGQDRFQEIYRLRPLWALYLAATNLDTNPLHLNALIGEQETPTNLGYRPFFRRTPNSNQEQLLPAAPLPPGGTLLVPLATLLGPIQNVVPETMSERSSYLPGGQGQVIAHQNLTVAYEGTAFIGPAFWPRSLRLVRGGTPHEQSIHEFDLSNLYTIGRFWEAGSCPHVFIRSASSRSLIYLGELFARQPGLRQMEHLVVPQGTIELLIVELETEYTTIEEAQVNGVAHSFNLYLEKGDIVRFAVRPGDVLELTGYYTARKSGQSDPWFRNTIVHEFMSANI